MLEDLYRRGTPENTLRAWERDLAYLTAWKQEAFGAKLDWPEAEAVALRFILDHSSDLSDATSPAKDVADKLIAAGFRRSLTCPAPSTLDRRIASWRAFHRMRNLPSPFDAPLIRQARNKARKAAARPPPTEITAPHHARGSAAAARNLRQFPARHPGSGDPDTWLRQRRAAALRTDGAQCRRCIAGRGRPHSALDHTAGHQDNWERAGSEAAPERYRSSSADLLARGKPPHPRPPLPPDQPR